MRILCVIDSLGSGGAQRQMVNLACGLKAKGHDVELLVYHPQLRFFRDHVDGAGIRVHEVSKSRGFSLKVPIAIARVLRGQRFDAMISFLGPSNTYAILGTLLSGRRVRLVVSERASSAADVWRIEALVRRLSYAFADHVVANSYTHSHYLRRFGWLRAKVSTVYNGYALGFAPAHKATVQRTSIRCLVVGRVNRGKNSLALAEALVRFHSRNGYVPELAWAGRQEQDGDSLTIRERIEDFLLRHPVIGAAWQWLGERPDVPQLIAGCDVVVHPSLHEGLPNVICEAFIAGRPVIASAVCDHPLLVEDGVRGLLCDPLSPQSICEALERFVALSEDQRKSMGQAARRYAEQHLSVDRMVGDYEKLLGGS